MSLVRHLQTLERSQPIVRVVTGEEPLLKLFHSLVDQVGMVRFHCSGVFQDVAPLLVYVEVCGLVEVPVQVPRLVLALMEVDKVLLVILVLLLFLEVLKNGAGEGVEVTQERVVELEVLVITVVITGPRLLGDELGQCRD